MEPPAVSLYLELLKRTLLYALWPEPGVPLAWYAHRRPAVNRAVLAGLARLAARVGFQLLRAPRDGPEAREAGRAWPACAHTMIGRARLDHLHRCVETVLAEGVPGDLLEAGVWRGGASILMKGVLAVRGDDARRVFLADSFRGLPPPDAEKYPADRGDNLYTEPILAVGRAQVEAAFRAYGLLDARVVFLEGWFKDTLPAAPFAQLALLRTDGDLYESTTDILVHAYPRLSPGGFCIIDDFALPNCRRAVEDYRAAHDIRVPIRTIDWTGAFWRKA